MTLYLWDTNTLSDYYRQEQTIAQMTASIGLDHIAISIPTVEEVLRGRMAQVAIARNEGQRVFALRLLHDELLKLRSVIILGNIVGLVRGICESLRLRWQPIVGSLPAICAISH